MQAPREENVYLIFYLDINWGWVVSVTPRPRFTPEKDPDTQCTEGGVGLRADKSTEAREKNPLPLPGTEPLSSSL
jgi:hypothetical protein